MPHSEVRTPHLSGGFFVWLVVGIVLGIIILGIVIVQVRHFRSLSALEAGQELLTATEIGNLEQMQTLLSKRAAVNARNVQGWTPLHVAASGGDPMVVELLLQHGADVNAESHIGGTPLDHAMTYGRSREVIALLESHGATGNTGWDSLF